MHCSSFCKCVPGSFRAFPKLAEPGHRDIVQSHFSVNPQNYPIILSQADAQLRLLTGNQRRIIATDSPKCFDSDHRVTATVFDLAYGRIPFNIGQTIVNGSIRISLATTPADDDDLRTTLDYCSGTLKPAGHHLTITIDKLNESYPRIKFNEPRKAHVSPASHCEWQRQVKLNHIRTQSTRNSVLPSVDPEST